jgi:hypothetical protein
VPAWPTISERSALCRSAIVLLALTNSALGDDWQNEGKHDGVEISSRKRGALKEVRGVATLPVAAERLFAVLGDIGRYPEIMPPTEDARLLHKEGAVGWFHLIVNPPIVSRRDYCIRVSLERRDGLLISDWHQTEEHCAPPAPSVVRMRAAAGRWTLRPSGAETEVEYIAFTDPAGVLPAWAVNRSVLSSLPNIFHSLEKAARQARYARCRAEDFNCP